MGIPFFNPFILDGIKPKACIICGCKLLKTKYIVKKNEINNHGVDWPICSKFHKFYFLVLSNVEPKNVYS